MPRRNLYILVSVAFISLLCYRKADSAHRSQAGRMFDTFVEVLNTVKHDYVEEVDDRTMFEGALNGMVSRLDPYSAYIGPQEAAEFEQVIEQKFGGIGIEVTLPEETKVLTVLSPMVGTPAWEKGVRPGDLIMKINGESTEGFNLEDAVRRMRGRAGEPVRLTILHSGEQKPIDVEIERAIIHVNTVLGDHRLADGTSEFMLPGSDHVAYIRITSFSAETVSELETALKDLKKAGMKALVLDLRDNAGGLLKAATEACDLFISKGRIVSTVGRNHVELETYDASGRGQFTDFPMTVLVNRYTASASEIVAACLQDHNRAVVIGERSWGKGSVQNVIRLEGGKSLLKLTTASYWRPSGKNIHRLRNAKETDVWGVQPQTEYAVPLTPEQLKTLVLSRRQRDVIPTKSPPPAPLPPAESFDPVLAKALEYLHGRLSQKS